MKKLLFCLALYGATLASLAQTGRYSLCGSMTKIDKAEGKMVYLKRSQDDKVIDSAKVVDGRFCFSGEVAAPTLANVSFGNIAASVVLEAGEITVDMVPRGFVQTKPKGTPLNEQLSACIAAQEELFFVSDPFKKDSTLTQEQRDERFNAQFKVVQTRVLDFFQQNRENQFGAYLLPQMTWLSAHQFDSLYNTAGLAVRDYPAVEKIVARNEKIRNTSAGKMFVDFAAQKTDGTTSVKLSHYVGKGQWVLADFWASWCGPCIGELPNLKAVYAQYKEQGVEVLGVNVWDRLDQCQEAIVKHELPWASIFVGDETATDSYGINGIPHLILFAPDGTIAARGLRGEGVGKEIAKQLAAAQKSTAKSTAKLTAKPVAKKRR